VVNTGGSTNTYSAYGIEVDGPGSRVLNNDVYETKEQFTGYGVGIYITSGDGSVAVNNRVGNQALGTGTSRGIYINNSDDVIVKSNAISKMGWGIYFGASTGLYGDNLASGCPIPFTGGTPAGSTNYSN
jgi:nitrous oxidase accessory protein NosD